MRTLRPARRPRRSRRGPASRWFLQKRVQMLAGELVGEGSYFLEAHAPLAVDEECLRHAVDSVADGDPTGGVGRVREAVAELGEELPRRLFLVLDVDADDRHALVLVRAPGPLEGRRFLVAGGHAPRGPEVEHHDLAAKPLEAHGVARERREGKGRGRLAEER